MRVPWSVIRLLCGAGAVASLAAAGVRVYPYLYGAARRDAVPLPEVPSPSGGDGPSLRGPERYAHIHKRLDVPDDPPPPAMPTRLPVTLINIMLDPGGNHMASIKNSQDREKWYEAGAVVKPDDVEVVEIRNGSVQVKWKGKLWVLDMKTAAPPAAVRAVDPGVRTGGPAASEQKFEVPADKFQDYVANLMSKYYQQGEYRWLKEGGVEIRGLAPDAEARKYGFQAKDVIQSVNGHKLTGIASVTPLLGDLTSGQGGTFVVEGSRGGQTFRTEIKVK